MSAAALLIAARSTARPDGCVMWDLALNGDGYAQTRFGGRLIPVHRIAFELARGPIPAGQEIDHLCRNRACLNPDHLEAVGHDVNIARRVPSPRGYRLGRYRAPSEARRAAQRRYAAARRARKAVPS